VEESWRGGSWRGSTQPIPGQGSVKADRRFQMAVGRQVGTGVGEIGELQVAPDGRVRRVGRAQPQRQTGFPPENS
jgi:hypothetical protein